MIRFRLFNLIIFGLYVGSFTAQCQRLTGSISSYQSKIGIGNAQISIKMGEFLKVTHSDSLGRFLISNIPFGRYDVEVRCLGYEPIFNPQVFVMSGKDTFLELFLKELPQDLKEVIVKSSSNSVLGSVSIHNLNIQQTSRYAATWGDPARMALSLPGVTTVNDNSNQLVVRGNSPMGVLWRVEGVEIPNPNHFSADGASGGAIGILSSSVLGNSSFLTGAFPAQFGNAISAVYDIALRSGNVHRREHHLQANLLGFEIGSEGYFKKEVNSSYIIHARSVNPILVNKLGFSSIFDSAQPKFQDLVFKIQGGNAKNKISVWGIGGRNSLDYSLVSFANLTNSSQMVASGAKFESFTSEKVQWRTIFSFSSISNENSQNLIGLSSEESKFSNLKQDNFRYVAEIDWMVRSNQKIESGLIVSRLGYNLNSSLSFAFPSLGLSVKDTQLEDQGNTYFGQFYLQTEQKFGHFSFRYGLHSNYFFLNKHVRIDPRWQMRYSQKPTTEWYVGLGQHSRLDPISIYLFKNSILLNGKEVNNQSLVPPRGRHVVMGFQNTLKQGIKIKSELYFQKLDKVAIQDTVIVSSLSPVSLLNQVNSVNLLPLKNGGEGRNFGWELTIEKKMKEGYYGLFTSSLFRSQFRNDPLVKYNPSRFDNRFVINGLLGKEWIVQKQLIDINFRASWSGGIRRIPSMVVNDEVISLPNQGYSERLANYLRVDIKLNYILDFGRTSSTFSVDVNNIFDRLNPLTKIYNPIIKDFVIIPQLGLLPVLSYTFNF